MPKAGSNYTSRLSLEERRAHTVPGRRANQYRAAVRRVGELVAPSSLLTAEQLAELAGTLAAEATARAAALIQVGTVRSRG